MDPTPRRPPVMADVAARAGVSHQTVSRVLNSPGLVRPETRDRVLRSIAELGYRRNLSARALVTNRSPGGQPAGTPHPPSGHLLPFAKGRRVSLTLITHHFV